MPRIVVLLSLLFVFASSIVAQSKAFVDGEVLVKFRPGMKSADFTAFGSATGSELLENLGREGWVRVRIADRQSVSKAIGEMATHEDVIAVQPNFIYRLAATPNDPQYTNTGLYGLGRISAPSAWDLTTGSSTVVVANIDTGMRYTHEDLAANMWTNPGEINGNGVDDDGNGYVDDFYGYDFRFNDGDPLDENGHGTHVGGTIGAVGNNAIGITGVNWNVRLMAIKIYSASGLDSTSAMLINAYNYVRIMKERGVNIKVTNNSYADCPEACGYDQATKDAIDALGDAGVLNVFAAGNNGRNIDQVPIFPASYTSPSLLTVASSTSTDARSGFSNFGPIAVDVAAPGSGIFSTTFGTNSSYGALSGTSMATPHVTGAAALLAAQHPTLSAMSLKATLMNSVDVLPAWSGVVKTGGRINVRRALETPTVCDLTLSQSDVRLPTKGGVVTINVTAPANCDYSVKSNSLRDVAMMGPALFSGSGNVTFRVGVNPTISRTLTMKIGDKTVTIRQSRN